MLSGRERRRLQLVRAGAKPNGSSSTADERLDSTPCAPLEEFREVGRARSSGTTKRAFLDRRRPRAGDRRRRSRGAAGVSVGGGVAAKVTSAPARTTRSTRPPTRGCSIGFDTNDAAKVRAVHDGRRLRDAERRGEGKPVGIAWPRHCRTPLTTPSLRASAPSWRRRRPSSTTSSNGGSSSWSSRRREPHGDWSRHHRYR